MADYLVKLLIEAGQSSITESYYRQSEISIQDVEIKASKLAGARVKLLGDGAKCAGVFVSNCAVRNDSLMNIRQDWVPNNKNPLNYDTPGTGFYFRHESGANYRYFRLYRFPPDAYVSSDVNVDGLFAVREKILETWGDFLTANGWCFRALLRGVDAPDVPVQDVSKDNNSFFLITAAAHGLVNGAKVKLSGFTNASLLPLNGIHYVFERTDNTFIIRIVAPLVVTYGGGAIAQKRVYGLKPITSAQFVRIGTRDTKSGGSFPRRGSKRRAKK